MEFGVAFGGPGQEPAGCVVVGVHEAGALAPSARALDAVSGGALTHVVERGDFDGELGATLLLHRLPGVAAERVLLIGLGPEPELGESRYRAAVGAATKALRTTGAADVTLCLHELRIDGRDVGWKVEQAVLALTEGLYRFDRLKSRPPPAKPALKAVRFQLADRSEVAAVEAAFARAAAIAEGVVLAKDLGNLPANLCTPAYLADQAHELARCHGLGVTILDQADIDRLGMGAFLAVARGSRQPPKLVVMEYRGADRRDARPVVLVGKGITFDAGGVSLKAAHEMDEMKFDMCGAAAVFGAVRAAALMKLPLDIVGIVPATENMPDGNAIKPGDVVTTMSGRTVEILDTDCEGRLVLCDALTYAERYDPAAVVDVATLTGEIVTALGDVASGLFSNSDPLARAMVEAGNDAWDRVWPMPLWDEYQEALQSKFADLPNIGMHGDCAVTAACFLSRFTRRYPWVHLDIAGTAARSGDDKGATGRPVALLAHFLVGCTSELLASAAASRVDVRRSDP